MTSSDSHPEGSAGQRGRSPPTIDLEATEIGGESAPAAAQAQQSKRSASGFLTVAAAGTVGVVLTLVVLAMAGVFSSREAVIDASEARLARVEQQLREITTRPTAGADATAGDDLAARVRRLEAIATTPKAPVTDAALANRIAALDGEIKALGERVGVLARRSDEIASLAGEARTRADAVAASLAALRKVQLQPNSRVELSSLSGRLAALEAATKELEAQLNQSNTQMAGGDRSLRRLVVASALAAAVERGTPFAAELGAAKAIASDPQNLAPLEPFAMTGVPGTDLLARELLTLVPALAKAFGAAPPDGIIERLKANAEKIVRVRRIEDIGGDDPAAVLQRLDVRATQGNIAGAEADIAKLPAPARALAKQWITRVAASHAAIAASRRFSADALAVLVKPSQ